MKILYTRCSTQEQNPERQLQNSQDFDYVLVDYCSGSTPLFERPQGKQLKELTEKGVLKNLTVHSIDRLGRSTVDVLLTWEYFTKSNVIVECSNPRLRNIGDDGKIDSFSQLLLSILSCMAEHEKKLISERQMEGINIRKAKGLYGGRKIGSKENLNAFLKKKKTLKIIEYLNKKYAYNEISKIVGCSTSTIVKTNRILRNISKD
jgi:DNA invertase Pin-like site-specific DNA recombinase